MAMPREGSSKLIPSTVHGNTFYTERGREGGEEEERRRGGGDSLVG